MSEQNHQAARIQTSILSASEKRVLVYLAERMPKWVTSDMLTFVGFLGSLVMAAGYALSNLNLLWMWLASFGVVMNWFGDSLDGSLARVRKTQRKVYGFYIDHNVDVINETIMFLGVGMSPMMNLSVAMACLVAYFMISIYVFINCHLKDEMRLTYAGLGPTEFRIVLIIINILFIYVPFLSQWKVPMVIFHNHFMMGVLDFVGMAITLLILVFYVFSFFKDARYFAKIDPLVKKEEEK